MTSNHRNRIPYNNPNLAAFNTGVSNYMQNSNTPRTVASYAIPSLAPETLEGNVSQAYTDLYGYDPNNTSFLKKITHRQNNGANGFKKSANVVEGVTGLAETADDAANLVGKKFNFKNIANFDKGKGLSIGGKNIGKYIPYGVGIYQGLDALGGLSEMSDLNADADTLTSQILTSAAGNPLISNYLTSDDLSLLGKLQRGSYDASADLGDATSNLGNLLTGAGSGALMGLAGGVPGAIVGGIGGLINSGIDNMNAETTNNTARLEALYQNLLNAEQQYKSMRRPNFNGLGIQQRYQNMYM